jgi:hypothetical protein
MYQVMGVRKIENTDPQEFEIRLKDKENIKPGYMMTTDNGTEPELRARLQGSRDAGPRHRKTLQAGVVIIRFDG